MQMAINPIAINEANYLHTTSLSVLPCYVIDVHIHELWTNKWTVAPVMDDRVLALCDREKRPNLACDV